MPWWHSPAQKKIFEDKLALKHWKLADPCGFCAGPGGSRFGADCRRTKRALEVSKVKSESVAPTNLGRATREGEDNEERDVAT